MNKAFKKKKKKVGAIGERSSSQLLITGESSSSSCQKGKRKFNSQALGTRGGGGISEQLLESPPSQEGSDVAPRGEKTDETTHDYWDVYLGEK